MNDTADNARKQQELDRLARQAAHFLRRWNVSGELRRACAVAPLWLFAGPLGLLLVSPSFVSIWWLVLLALAGPAIYVAGRLVWVAWRYRPARHAGLALFDAKLDSRDRLVTADEFLHEQAAPSRFMLAAVDDADSYLRSALNTALEPRPLPPWHLRPVSGLGILAAVAIALMLFRQTSGMYPALSNQDSKEESTAGPQALGDEKTGQTAQTRREMPAELRKSMDEQAEQTDPESQPPSMQRPAGDERVAEGQTGAAGASASQSSSSASQSVGRPSGDKSASKSNPQEDVSSESRNKPKVNPQQKKNPKPQENRMAMAPASGQGGASVSASSPSPFESPEQPDKSGATPKQDDPADEAQNEEQQEKAASASTPSLRDRKAPVDRNASSRPSSEDVPLDANGRGGAGARKKSRGVPSMILGIPVADRVQGMSSPGSSRVTREEVKPSVESHPLTEAQKRAARSGIAGNVRHPGLSPWMQQLIRDYFVSEYKQAGPR